MTVLTNLLAILAKDTEGAAVSALTTFNASVQQTSDPQEVVAAGGQLVLGLATALPSIENNLIKDTSNLLVGDAISEIQTLAAQAQTAAAAAPASQLTAGVAGNATIGAGTAA